MTLTKELPVMLKNKAIPSFFSILNANKDLSFIVNLETFKFEYISEQSLELFGLTPEQIESLSVHKFFQLIHPTDIVKLNEKVEENQDCNTLEEISYRFKYKNLRYKWLSEKRQILYSQLNEPAYMISSCKEI